MTVKELAINWIINDMTGSYYHRKITIDEATAFIEHMDPDTIESLTECIDPEAFMEAWNDFIEEE